MNELILYAIFGAVLKKSRVIEGRFFVMPEGGAELNTNTIGATITDMLGNIASQKKYPAAVMLPPLELVSDHTKGWSRFKIRILFVTPKNSTGGEMKNWQPTTNTSGHPTTFDWKDMRECAGDFRSALEQVILYNGVLDKIRPVDRSTDVYERMTLVANDKLNGVSLSFDIDIFLPCELKDYRDVDLQAVTLNFNDPHPLHKH
jgi:hypothetical protein